MTKEVLTLALEALKLSDTVFYPQTKIAIAAIERAIANHIEDNLVMVAQPTPAEYAMGYAEGFNDGCKPKPEQEPASVTYKQVADTMNFLWYGNVEQVQMAELLESKKLYTTPPQRTWVGLTDREFEEVTHGMEDLEDCWIAIEAKLREKNG
jgi:hypothetical protein